MNVFLSKTPFQPGVKQPDLGFEIATKIIVLPLLVITNRPTILANRIVITTLTMK